MPSRVVESPIGPLRLVANDDALVAIEFDATPEPTSPPHPILDWAERELAEYFGGTRRTFTVKLAPVGTTFQQRVWDALLRVPYGKLESYGAVARAIGSPAAVRAVGAANGRNPIPIIVPCHRIVGSNGDLTGYGGGMAKKQWLLGHEGTGLGRPLDLFAPRGPVPSGRGPTSP
jgi:methylated-DNA-[protein]-cysteine S-methyltransferase